jgi:hypothetical protein
MCTTADGAHSSEEAMQPLSPGLLMGGRGYVDREWGSVAGAPLHPRGPRFCP